MRFVLIPLLGLMTCSFAQRQPPTLTEAEKPIYERVRTLRRIPDDERRVATGELARSIRALPPGANKLMLAGMLANLSTEGDFGRDTLQEVTATLETAVREQSSPAASHVYDSLAALARYEGMKVTLDDAPFRAAAARLAEIDRRRASATFALTDLQGQRWSLGELRGKVVLVNFWATWCPPCRKEMPDLQTLQDRWRDKGLVVLAISDEQEDKVRPFIAQNRYTYPILLDPGRVAHKAFEVDGIPKTFVFDRSGKLVAQAMDMRTEQQFLRMLEQAGLR